MAEHPDLFMHSQTTQILHVDDDPAITRLLARQLKAHGIDVTALHDPTQAIGRIAEGNFRIVIVDLQMPEMDGFELLKRIKGADGGTAVIVLTGLVTQTSVMCSMREGAAACFFKPLTSIDGLLDCIAEINKSFDRWRTTLQQLAAIRRSEATMRYSDYLSTPAVCDVH